MIFLVSAMVGGVRTGDASLAGMLAQGDDTPTHLFLTEGFRLGILIGEVDNILGREGNPTSIVEPVALVLVGG